MYADYSYYSNDWAGTELSAQDFDKYAKKAERLINFATQRRISDVTEQVKNAVCAAAEAAFEVRSSYENIPQGIKSENTDGYSVSYKDYDVEAVNTKEQSAMLKAIKIELSGTGLLYRGVR